MSFNPGSQMFPVGKSSSNCSPGPKINLNLHGLHCFPVFGVWTQTFFLQIQLEHSKQDFQTIPLLYPSDMSQFLPTLTNDTHDAPQTNSHARWRCQKFSRFTSILAEMIPFDVFLLGWDHDLAWNLKNHLFEKEVHFFHQSSNS